LSTYPLVQAGFGAPLRQKRLKVAFRLILAIPLFIWAILLGIAAGVLVIIGWFAALFMGRLPKSFVQPLSDFIVFLTRIYSYFYLMNDAYPPFSAKKEFTVNLEIPTTKVRRLAVLFRIVLLIPVGIVSTLASGGVLVAAVFIWLIVLVKGEMPLSLFGALAAVLRYQARFYAYYMMLTSKYPGELFGDQPPTSDLSWSSAGAPTSIPPLDGPPPRYAMNESVPESSVTAVTSSESETDTPEVATTPPPPTGAPMVFTSPNDSPAQDDVPPRTARLVLSRASKNILVIFIVLGAIGQVSQRVLDNRILNNQSALTRLTTANATVDANIKVAAAQRTRCTLGTNVCLQRYLAATATAFDAFQSTLDSTNFPSNVQGDANQFISATQKFVAYLDLLKDEASVTSAQLQHLDSLGNDFDTTGQQVINDLSSPI
jgi:hypothetical protein